MAWWRRRRARPGAPAAPLISGVTPEGAPITVPAGTIVLAFLTSSCLPCRPLWAALAGRPATAVITPDPTTEDRAAVAALAPPGLPVVMSSAAWVEYEVRGSSTIIVVEGGQVRGRAEPETPADLAAFLGKKS